MTEREWRGFTHVIPRRRGKTGTRCEEIVQRARQNQVLRATLPVHGCVQAVLSLADSRAGKQHR